MKKLRAEIQLMKAAFLAISMFMTVIFGFMMAVAEIVGGSAAMVIILVLTCTVTLLSLAASGVLPFGNGEEDSGDEEI